MLPEPPPSSGGLVFSGNQPPAARAFAGYSYTPLVTGGVAPLSFSLDQPVLEGWSFDPDTGIYASQVVPSALPNTTTSPVPFIPLPEDLTITATDALGQTASFSPNDVTLAPSIIPVRNFNGAKTAATAYLPPVEARKFIQQHLFVAYVKPETLSAAVDGAFTLGLGPLDQNGILTLNFGDGFLQLSLGGGFNADVTGGAVSGEWMQIIAQITRTTAHGRTTTADRGRIWFNGIKRAPEASISSTFDLGTGEDFNVQCGSWFNNRNFDGTQGYYWLWSGPVADLPLIDFDNPENRVLFEPDKLNPLTGIVDFGGSIGTVQPDVFLHGDEDDWNDELVNKGAWTGLTLTRRAGNYRNWKYDQSLVIVPDTAVANRSSITSDGVTFNFDAAYPSAQFSDGSWWVNGSGDLDIVSMTPASADLDRDWIESGAPGTTGLRWANGATVNMSNAAKIASNESQGGSAQGFDEFIGNGLGVAYHDAFNVDPGRTGSALTLATGTVLKAVSQASVLYAANGSGQGAGVVRDLVPLTVFNGAPPSGMDFRPGFSGDAPLISIGNSDIDLSGLPNLSAVTSAPDFFLIYNQIKKFQEGALNSIHRSTRNITAENSYGREHSAMTNQACAILCLSAYTTDQKQAMAKAIVQYGIDLADLVEKENSLGTRVRGLGGTGHGRKIVLTMAALLTDNTRLKDALDWAVTDGGFFYEDMQIKQIQQSWIDQWPSSAYTGRLNGGEFFDGLPGPALGDPDWNKRYRHIFSIGSTGANNLLHAVTGLAALWDNDLFRNYMDYYWAFEAARTPAFSGEQSDRLNLTSGESSFYRNFRQTHGGSWTNVGPMGGL